MTDVFVLKAQRICTVRNFSHDDGETITAIMFMPKNKRVELDALVGQTVQIELDDETGEWSNDKDVYVEEVTVSPDGRAVVIKTSTV